MVFSLIFQDLTGLSIMQSIGLSFISSSNSAEGRQGKGFSGRSDPQPFGSTILRDSISVTDCERALKPENR